MISDMIKRLSRFIFGKSGSSESFSATPPKNSKNPNASSEGANPVPIYTPPSHAHLDSELISIITTCFNLWRDLRDTLRLPPEMKTEGKCLFDGEKFIREYHYAYNTGMLMRRELLAPVALLDREWAWRKIPKYTSGGTANGTVGGVASWCWEWKEED